MVDDRDLARLELQLGRAPIPPLRIACRCAAGWPVVVEQPAHGADGEPFPTAYWLSCPGLVKAISRIEGAGGVRALEQRLAGDPALAASFDAAMERHRALRPEHGLGIGGVRSPRAVKCLHAHAAFAPAGCGGGRGGGRHPRGLLHGARVTDAKTEVALQAWAEAPAAARRVRVGLDQRGLDAFERAAAAVLGEMVRRVGQTYALADLAAAWREADRWAPDLARDAAAPGPPPRSSTLLVDLACARLMRSARDARPPR